MFLQSLLRWFQKRRASSWNQLYTEAPVTTTGASVFSIVDWERFGAVGLTPLYFPRHLIPLQRVARATNRVAKREAIQ
jgi:hypothetical protein